jgi:hydroxypyruvate reductase
MDSLRQIALSLFRAALERADPEAALRQCWHQHPLSETHTGRRFVLAIGKAGVPMMRAAQGQMKDIHKAIVVTNPENASPLDRAKVMVGGHPVPDDNSFAAGQVVMQMLREATQDDQVIVLVSGGGSALVAAPLNGISRSDYARMNEILLSSGLDIRQMNLIRQQIDSLKGGGLLRYSAPASVYGYVLSDVVSDDLRCIASGPTVSPIGAPEDAVSLLQD